MTRLASLLLALLALSPLSAQDATPDRAAADLDRFLQELDALRQTAEIPGLSVALVKDEELILAHGLGLADLERQATCVDGAPAAEPPDGSLGGFTALLEALASAWNEGDAARAADCFTPDAVYLEPPAKQLYRGRQELFEFFGGDEGRPGQMSMRWHHLAFNPETQIGFGEFSFTYGTTAHGVAVVRLRDGKIANWREYWYESDLPWGEFVRENPF